jgi:hypothetical protein
VTGTELMPKLVGDNTEHCCSKLKNRNSFSKPNFETLPSLRQVRQVCRVDSGFWVNRLYLNFKNSSGRVYEELLLEKGAYPGGEVSLVLSEPVVLDGVDVVEAAIANLLILLKAL